MPPPRRNDPYASAGASGSAAASPTASTHASTTTVTVAAARVSRDSMWPAVPVVDSTVEMPSSGAHSPPTQRSSSASSNDHHHHHDQSHADDDAPTTTSSLHHHHHHHHDPEPRRGSSSVALAAAARAPTSAGLMAASEEGSAVCDCGAEAFVEAGSPSADYYSAGDGAAVGYCYGGAAADSWPPASSSIYASAAVAAAASAHASIDTFASYAAAMYARSMHEAGALDTNAILREQFPGSGGGSGGTSGYYDPSAGTYVVASRVYGEQQQPQPSSAALNKIERKRRQRKRRVARRKERERERRAALAAGLEPPADRPYSDDDSSSCSSSADGDDDEFNNDRQRSATSSPAYYVTRGATSASPECESEDDPDAIEIPVGPSSSASAPPMPVPRSHGHQQLQPTNAATTTAAATSSSSPAVSSPLASAMLSTYAAKPASAPPTAKPVHMAPVAVVSEKKKTAAPAKKKDEWQVVGGKAAAKAAAAPTANAAASGSSAAASSAAAGNNGAATKQNPFALLASGKPDPKPQPTAAAATVASAAASVAKSTSAVTAKPKPAQEESPKPAATTSSRGKKPSSGDDFEAVLAQLERATSAASGGVSASASSSSKASTAPTAFDGGVPIVDLIACVSSPLASAAVAAIRKAEARGKAAPNSFARVAAINPLERCCHTGAGAGSSAAYLRLLARIELADICIDLQDGDQAVVHATAAVAAAAIVDDATLTARAYLRLAKGHEATGDAPQAMEATRCALSAPADVPIVSNPRFVAHCLACYGSVADLAGQPDVSMRCLDAAEVLAKRANDRRLMVDIAGHKAASLLAHGNFDGAIALLEPLLVAVDGATAPTSPCASLVLRDASLLLRVLPTLAQAYYTVGTGKWRSVLEAQAERLEAARDEVSAGSCYSLLAQLSRSELQPKESLLYTNKEIRLLSAPQHQCRTCDALSAAGSCYTMLGLCQRARAQHSHELENARASGDTVAEAKALIGKGHAELADKDPRAALKAVMGAMSLLDQVPASQRARYIVRVSCYETEWKALDLLEAVHLQLGNTPFAARVADHKHVAELQPLLLQASPRMTPPPRLSAVLRPSDGLPKAAAAGVDLIVSYSFAWNDAATTLNVYAIEPSTNKHHAVAVEFPIRTMALLAADNSKYRRGVSLAPVDTILLMHRLGRLVEIAARGELRSDLEDEPFPTEDGGIPDRWLGWLYEDLVGPIAPHLDALKPNSRVVFIADGFFSAVPFAALRATPDRPSLLNRFVVTTAPSVTVLGKLLERTAKPRDGCVTVGTAAAAKSSCPPKALAEEMRAGAESCIAHVDWRVALDTVEPFVGGIVLDGGAATKPAPTKRKSSKSNAEATPMPESLASVVGGDHSARVNIADVVAATANAAPSANSTAVMTGMIGTTNRIGHDVSIPPHFAVFLLGFARTLRPLYPAAAKTAAKLAEGPVAEWDGAEPSAESFRQVCLKMQAAGSAEWHGLLLAGAL